MLDDRILPAAIADERAKAVIELAERLEAIDRTVLLMYHIDTVPAAALFALAWQFDVLGFNGWDLTHNEAERRALLKSAIERHRYRGTKWAIEAALDAAGYADAVVEEGIAAGLDHWAKFQVRVALLTEEYELTQAERDLIRGVVLAYKNARSTLDGLRYSTPPVVDNGWLPADPPMDIIVNALFFHDATYDHDAEITHRGSSGEPITIP